MTQARIVFGSAARARMMRGADALTSAVKVTLGPRGRNVLLDGGLDGPQVTKDGASVAERIEFADIYANMGARLLREVATATGEAAGDGTTTATLLANSILLGGVRAIAAELGAVGVKRGIDLAVDTALARLRAAAEPVSDPRQLAHIAAIAANGDGRIGVLIADALAAAGEHGDVLVENGRATTDKLETISGMWFDRGYISRHFVTDEVSLSAELRNPLILLYGSRICSLDGLMPYLDRAADEQRPLLIIAEEVENEALTTLVVNRQTGGLKVVAVRAPGFSDHRRDNLEDLAVLTGAQVVLGEPGLDLENATPDVMGRARRVHITAARTLIVGGAGSADAVAARIGQLQRLLGKAGSPHAAKILRQRIAKLNGTIATILAGGYTATEIAEKRRRIDKALGAARAAAAEGFVAGGGTALLHAAKALDGLVGADCDEYAGIQIVRRALAQPAGQIAANAGADGSAVVGRIAATADRHFGYDANAREHADVVTRGIIDPLAVVCTALRTAASVAGPLLLAEAAVAEKPVKKIPRHPFACKCSDHDHHDYPGDPYHEHHLPHSHGHPDHHGHSH